MKNYCFIVYVFCFLLITNCVPKDEPIGGAEYQHTKSLMPTSKKISFSLNEKTINKSNLILPFTDSTGEAYLVYVSENENEIQFYSWKNQSLVQRTKCRKEGPNGVGAINGIYVVSLDSIFIFSNNNKTFFSVDSKGAILKKINFANNKKDDYVFDAPIPYGDTHYYTPIELYNGKFYFVSLLMGNWNAPSKEGIRSSRICFEVDINGELGEYSALTYPKDYWDNGTPRPLISRTLGNKNFVYSFAADHNIYVTKDHVNFKRLDAKSDFRLEFNYKQLNTIEEVMRSICEKSSYESIIYDPYRKVYYRFVRLGVETNNKSNLRLIADYPTRFSIIILNGNFEKIGETIFENNEKFLFNNVIVQKEGLYISNSNPNNKHFDDDVLSFTLLKLMDNEIQ